MKFVKLKSSEKEITNTDHIKRAYIDENDRKCLMIEYINNTRQSIEFEGIELAEEALHKILKQGNQAPVKFEYKPKPSKQKDA